MSPHNTRYKNKGVSVAAKIAVAAKFEPNSLNPVEGGTKSKQRKPSSPGSSPSGTRSGASSSASASASGSSGEISKPKRPLSAYNLFFKHARDEMLASCTANTNTATSYDHSKHATTLQSPGARRDLSKKGRPPPHRKISFAEMARQIGAQWKALDEDRREHFEGLAKIDKQRYLREMDVWKAAGGDKQLAGTASPTGGTSTRPKASKSSKSKSPPSSPKSSKSKISRKKPKVASPSSKSKTAKQNEVTVVNNKPQPPQEEEVYSHIDYTEYNNLGSTLDRACESTYAQQGSGVGSAHSSASSLYEYANAGAGHGPGATRSALDIARDSSASAGYNNHHQSQQHYGHHQSADFQPPNAYGVRRVSEDSSSDWHQYGSSQRYEQQQQQHQTAYPSSHHLTGQQQQSYSTHHAQHQHPSSSTPPIYYPYHSTSTSTSSTPYSQQTNPTYSTSHRRGISCGDRNISIASIARPDVRASKIVSSNWNSTMTTAQQPSRTGASTATTCSTHTHQDWEPTKLAPEHVPKWNDDADRLLDVLGKIDEDDCEFWGTTNPTTNPMA